MATPTYKGQSQPAAASGGWLSSWFGSATPAYKLAPTTPSTSIASTSTAAPSTASASPRLAFFGFGAPAYKLAPQPSDSADSADVPQQFAIVIPRRALDSIDLIEPSDPQQQ
jgi:hypothetical protein